MVTRLASHEGRQCVYPTWSARLMARQTSWPAGAAPAAKDVRSHIVVSRPFHRPARILNAQYRVGQRPAKAAAA